MDVPFEFDKHRSFIVDGWPTGETQFVCALCLEFNGERTLIPQQCHVQRTIWEDETELRCAAGHILVVVTSA